MRWMRLLPVSALALLAGVQIAVGDECPISVETIKDQMIRESMARYQGPCACEFQLDNAGRRCAERSAHAQ